MIPKKELSIGQNYSKGEIEDIFDKSFGAYIQGIRKWVYEEEECIFLTHSEGGPYDDEIQEENDEFTYIGEGQKGDQQKQRGNQALINVIEEYIPVFFFVKIGTHKYEYQGLVDVLDYEYRYAKAEGRMKFYFDMERLEAATLSEYEKGSEHPEQPELTESVDYNNMERKVRSSTFRKTVRDQYENKCAICEARRFSPKGSPEVEAAHIYPKSEEGSDDPRNGIALCKLHHWAFDSGWLALSDNFRVTVKKEAGEIETPQVLLKLDDKEIILPKNPNYKPHEIFIREHRILHGFNE